MFTHTIFKHIKLLDLVIFVILVAVGLFFFSFFYRKTEFINIRVKVTDQDVLYANTIPQKWYARQFHKGDVELDAVGREITEILSVERIPLNDNQESVYLDLKVRSTYDSRTNSYSTRGKRVIFGIPMRFNLSGITFDGIIVGSPDIQENESKKEQVRVTTLLRGAEPFLAEKITTGDAMFKSDNQIIANIVNVVKKPAERVVQTDRGDLLLRHDPLYKDVTIVVEIDSEMINKERYVYYDTPLRVNSVLPLNFSDYSIFPIVTKIEKLK